MSVYAPGIIVFLFLIVQCTTNSFCRSCDLATAGLTLTYYPWQRF